jgi:hypothetical protein
MGELLTPARNAMDAQPLVFAGTACHLLWMAPDVVSNMVVHTRPN